MKMISKNLFTQIIMNGKDCGSAMGYVNNDKTNLLNVYVREYDNTTFILAENELTSEYFVLLGNDSFQQQEQYVEAMSGLKETLEDIIAILPNEKGDD